MGQQASVHGGDVGARCAVDKDGVGNVHFLNRLHHVFHTAFARFHHHVAVGRWIDAFFAVGGLGASANAHKVDFQSAFLHEFVALRRNLFQQTAAHRSRAADKEVELLIVAKEETIVEHIERFAQLAAFDDKREVHFQGSQCHSADADAVSSQHAEEFSRNARRALHALSNGSHSGQSVNELRRVHGAVGNLLLKLFIEQAAGAAAVGGGDAHGGARF